MGAHRLTSILGVPAAIAYSIYGKFAGPEAGGDAAGDEGQKQRHVDKVWTEEERKEFLKGRTLETFLGFASQDHPGGSRSHCIFHLRQVRRSSPQYPRLFL
eukprot:TRINITY_DN370_c0_g2_i2.p3 TRINITY_DN370_c0_g2~~TRINITY_DN370_c0_g2_i2.p3  ORF type:complete len:101 (+),score=1.47 TRINITY_DN370_c0_g2_i2:2-304(+)